MVDPLHPRWAPARRARTHRAPWARVAFGVAAIACGFACRHRNLAAPIAAELDRDRTRRADLSAEIAADHRALAELIASPRFEDVEAIYADPEVREIAERLIERTRKLARLSGTNVLGPGATPGLP